MRGYKLRRPNETWGDPVFGDNELDKAVHRRMGAIEGPVHLSEDGAAFGPYLARSTGTERLLTKVKKEDEGHWFRLWNKNGKGVTLRIVEVAPTPAKTGGSPGVDLLVGFLNKEFRGQWSNYGIYVYRPIAGSSTWSDHAYRSSANGGWCGRALDVGPANIAVGDAIHAAATREQAIMARLRYVLWRGVPNHYPGHLHFSFEDGGAPGRC